MHFFLAVKRMEKFGEIVQEARSGFRRGFDLFHLGRDLLDGEGERRIAWEGIKASLKNHRNE